MKGMPLGVLIQAGSTSLKQKLRRSNHVRAKAPTACSVPRLGSPCSYHQGGSGGSLGFSGVPCPKDSCEQALVVT